MIGKVTRTSKQAWRFTSVRKTAWLPKSLMRLFANELVGEVDTSQHDPRDCAADAGGKS